MKAFLLHKDQDFDLERELPPNEQALTQDLGLPILFEAMALDDQFLFEMARKAVLSSLSDPDSILYRQNILKDCLKNSSIVRDLYNLVVESIQSRQKQWWATRYPSSIMYSAVEALKMFVGQLKKLRAMADEHADKFDSEGFARFYSMLIAELDDEYFSRIEEYLRELKLRKGVLMSAELGKGNKAVNFVLHKTRDEKQSLMGRIFGRQSPAYSYRLSPRDEIGSRALSDLRDRGLNIVANVVAQSTDHILSFFQMLRTELAFYVGCLNLHGQLIQKGEPACFPVPAGPSQRKSSFHGLYDVCLALSVTQKVVGNDINADQKDLVIITGANQGGKSTFLRSIGQAQLMMQAGMFVPAESFSADVCNGVFTHFRREEDSSMESGKLDEELHRMSDIADNITQNSMLLFNESFASTYETDGSEIARQITMALVEKGIRVFFVTHLYEFAHGLFDDKMRNAIFLIAKRMPDGTRTFRLIEGEPLRTSYGEDLYHRILKNVRPVPTLLLESMPEPLPPGTASSGRV
ncbi:MAG: MutS-related protein [Syntrophobacteraceae bacterium]